MTRPSFRETIKSICMPWLLGRNGERIGYTIGLALDALAESTREAVKAWFPGAGPDDALPFIGVDRGIDRGPWELASDYAERLRTSMVTMKTSGSSRRLLRQLRHYFSPDFGAELSTVSDRGTWHTIDMVTAVVTKTKTAPASNWQWDAYAYGIAAAGTQRWRRLWIVVENSPWTRDVWDTFGTWDDGGTWDSDATIEEVSAFMRIVDKFRSACIHIPYVVISFTPGLYAVGNAPGAPMPDGSHDDDAVRLAADAMFWKGSPR